MTTLLVGRELDFTLLRGDLQLPDPQGDQVLEHLRNNEPTRDTPVAVLSADATHERIERLLAQGANDYPSKPIDVHRFLTILETFSVRRASRSAHQRGRLSSGAPRRFVLDQADSMTGTRKPFALG